MRSVVLTSAALLGISLAAGLGSPTEARAPSLSGSEATKIVGSSTVSPFAQTIANRLRANGAGDLTIEATGTGGGFRLFCAPEGPAITNASRPMKDKERKACQAVGFSNIVEAKVGFDGIVLATAGRKAPDFLSRREVFLALAAFVPNGSGTDTFGSGNCKLVSNKNFRWRHLRRGLPGQSITVFGPPQTSGTRDAFLELAMEAGARSFPCLNELRENDKKAFEAIAHQIREDGVWIDAGENDSALVETLVRKPFAIGIFGYSFLQAAGDKIRPVAIDGHLPSTAAIGRGDYPLSRPLYFYAKPDQVRAEPALKEYVSLFLSREALGSDGFLQSVGLIPLSERQGASCQKTLEASCEACACKVPGAGS